MSRLVLRLAVLVVGAALASSAAGVEAVDALYDLLNPKNTAQEMAPAFRVLDGQPDQGWSLVRRLLELTRSADAAQRERARWVLWCIVGPDAYKVLNDLGPEPDRDAAANLLIQGDARTRPWDGLTTSLALARSGMPSVDWIGLHNLTWMFDAVAPPGTPADRANVDRVFRDLRGVSALRLDDDAGRHPHRVWKRSLLKSASRWAPHSAHALAFLARDKSEYARSLMGDVFPDGRIPPQTIIAVTDLLLESAWFQPDELLVMLASTRGEARARVVSRALAAASRGSAPGRTILRYLSGESHPDEIRIAETLAVLEPAAMAQFQPIFDLVARQEVRGAGELVTQLMLHKEMTVRRAAWRMATLVPTLFKPEEAIAASVELGQTPTIDRIRELNPDPKALGIRLLRVLKGEDAGPRAAAVNVIGLVGSDVPEVRETLMELARSGDEAVRVAAADALDDEKARRVAHAPAVLRDLRSNDPATRLRAANRAQMLGMGDDERVTAALLRAVSAGDMPAREGLTLALERAHTTGSTPLKVLEELARSERDPTTRAYVKAALRTLRTAP